MNWRVLLPLVCVGAAFAQQQYEVGATFGYGWYRDVRVNAPGAEATVGIRNRFVAGAVVGDDAFEHVSGELRYLYHDGDPFLSAGSARANIQGQSHSVSYDVLIHVRDRDSRLRPFVAVGAGIKYYRTTGPEPSPQPLPQIVELKHEDQFRPLVSVGFGVKYRWRRNVIVRGDFRDEITPFPKHLFAPATGATDRGLFQQFTPMLGVSYWF